MMGRESSVKKMPIEFGIFSERVGRRRRAASPIIRSNLKIYSNFYIIVIFVS